MANDYEYRFIRDGFGMSLEAGAMRARPYSDQARMEAWSAGLCMGNFFETDRFGDNLDQMMEAFRDELPRYGLDPDLANLVIEGAKVTYEAAVRSY
jgi:hypothetical protein